MKHPATDGGKLYTPWIKRLKNGKWRVRVPIPGEADYVLDCHSLEQAEHYRAEAFASIPPLINNSLFETLEAKYTTPRPPKVTRVPVAPPLDSGKTPELIPDPPRVEEAAQKETEADDLLAIIPGPPPAPSGETPEPIPDPPPLSRVQKTKKEGRDMSDRKIVKCVACNEDKPHAAEDMCFACYRRHRRSQGLDRHATSSDEKKLRKAQWKIYVAQMTIFEDAGVNPADREMILAVLDLYLPLVRHNFPGEAVEEDDSADAPPKKQPTFETFQENRKKKKKTVNSEPHVM